MSSKDEKVTLRDDGEGGGGRSSSDGGVEGGGVDVRLDGDIEEPNLDSGVDPSISVDNADVGVEQSRLQMENTKLEDGVETFTDASSGKLDEVDSERVDAVTGERLSNIDDTRLSEVDGERLDSSGGDVGGEAQAITITIMDPGSLDPSALDPGTLSGALVTTVEAQSEDATGFMVNEDGTIVVQGDEGLHAVNDVSIALINSASDNTVTSLNQVPDSERTSSIIKADNSSLSKRRDALRKDFVSVSAAEEEEEDDDEEIGRHCFICNVDLPLENPDDSISVFKTQTTSSSRKVSVILSSLVGQTLTARKAHSDIMCRRCFSLLDRVDTLEVEIKSSKEEIVTKFQNTIAMYGGRARKRKPTAAVRRDFVFPKVEPEDDYEAKELDMDDNFEPTVDDLMQEEADERDDDNLVDVNTAEGDDTEWEPQTKRPRVKKEPVDIADPNAPPKRKRGRPRKGTTSVKSKEMALPQVLEIKMEHEDELEEDKAWDEENFDEEYEEGSDDAKVHQGVSGRRKVQGLKHLMDYEVMLPKRRSRDGGSAKAPVWLDEPLSCSECGSLFNNVALYKVHCTESHIEPRGLQCPYCPLVFEKKHDFDSHRIDHAPLGHVCQKCSIGFPSAALLIKHIQDHHPGKDNTCQRCNATFIDKEQLEHHYQFKHKVGRKKDDALHSISRNRGNANVDILCKECGKVCPSIIAYQSHKYNEHIYLYPFECKVCRRRFIKETYLKNHMKSHVDGNVECPKCLVKFGNGTYLTDHLYYVHGQKKGLMCAYCSKFFTTPTSLKLHTEMEHRDMLDVPCDKVCEVCGDKYPSLHSLKKHMFTHSRDHMCTYCKKKLSSKAALELHVNMIHTKEFSFFCPHCNREFFAKHLLQMHIKRVHSDRSDYAFKCSRCPKAYLQEWELTLHMKTHTNERNYKCDVCGEAFYTLSRMRYHRGTHKTTRDSECPMCSQMFRRDVDTKNHLRRVHKVVQPGRFMDMCIKLGRKKAQEQLEELMAVGTEQDDDEEKSPGILLGQQRTQNMGFMGDNHEHITLYSLKDDEDQEEPLQVVIPEGMELIVLKDSVCTQSSHHQEQQQGQIEQEENETVTYVEPHNLFGIIQVSGEPPGGGGGGGGVVAET
ncbi:uncharacterized protein LOC143038601 isoform X5 [Oratosquilla oratoria]|uniref:uncharacterized protein LOC143038601 isoform X5 n=1 Tax=Oratosquilla oratoria TaxID=337810 RepID=UPI003F77230A